MNHPRITILISSFAIAIFGGFFATAVSVQAAEVPSLINTAVAKEETVQQPIELTQEQRKAILAEVISSSQKEIENLTAALKELKLDDAWSLARDRFIDTLATSSAYYSELEARLNKDAVTLDEIKSIATDLKTWREVTYSPALKETGNMILLFQAESIHSVVQLRSVKISNDIKKLDRQKLVNTDTLKKYLAQAENSIKNAKALNTKAKDIYFTISIAPLQPEPIEGAEKTLLLIAQSTSTSETPVDPQDQVRDLTKEAIKELKTAYELFFKMNDRIRK